MGEIGGANGYSGSMVVVTPSEPLLIPQHVLNAALAVVAAFVERESLEATVSTSPYFDMTTGEGPMQLINVEVTREPAGGPEQFLDLTLMLLRELRERGLRQPEHNLIVDLLPAW